MLPDWLKVIQLQPRFLLGLWVLGALLLFLPANLATPLGIVTLRDHYRPWIGVGTLAAFAFWLVQLVPAIAKRWSSRKYRAGILKNLDGLTREERFELAYCIHRGQRTVYLKVIDSAAQSLCGKGLFIHGERGSILSVPFTIPLFVWDYIRANPQTILPEADWRRADLLEAFEVFEQGIKRNQF
jgi:hypothetical protein